LKRTDLPMTNAMKKPEHQTAWYRWPAPPNLVQVV
jgi:hypothetical protein